MKRSNLYAAALMLLGTAANAGDHAPGLKEFTIPGPRTIEAHVIYPTLQTGETTAFAGNKVWAPQDVQTGAKPDGTGHPLVVLSHGMYGLRFNQTWLATRLAAAGYVVVAMNHPGTSAFSKDRDLSRQLWERPADITRAIDAVLADPDLGATIDPNQIFAIGHSLGGFTVLETAGARFDVDQLFALCGGDMKAIACNAFDTLGVTIDDRAQLGADLSEPRVKAIVALDPGGTMGFTDASLTALDVPVLLISAGRTPEILDRSVESDRVAKLVPEDVLTYLPIDAAGHFDFLGLCNPNGLEVLKKYEPADVMVCEHGTEERQIIHDQVAEAVLSFLQDQRN